MQSSDQHGGIKSCELNYKVARVETHRTYINDGSATGDITLLCDWRSQADHWDGDTIQIIHH